MVKLAGKDYRCRTDMISFVLNQLLPVSIMILLCLVTSHAKAIQHPRSHRDLGRSKERSIPVTVRARNGLDFYSDSEITVACKAKGGKRIDETPFISFFIESENTHMRLSSGIPGVTLIPHSDSDYGNEYRAKTVLKLSKNFWHILNRGKNNFYCKASDISGHTGVAYFVINKKSHGHHSHQRRGTRGTYRHRMHYSNK